MQRYIAVSAEVLAQHAIVRLANFAFLDADGQYKAKGVTEDMCTHHKLKFFA